MLPHRKSTAVLELGSENEGHSERTVTFVGWTMAKTLSGLVFSVWGGKKKGERKCPLAKEMAKD